MAAPMTAGQFIAALKAEGVTVAEHSGWRTRNRAGHGGWGPMNGVMIHHTGGTAPSDRDNVWAGRSDLPGPLAHGYLAKSGTVTMTANGRANHAGGGDPAVLRAVVDQNFDRRPAAPKFHEGSPGAADGNAHFYGLEISNLGDGKDPYPAAQYLAAVMWATAVCRHHGWSEKSVIAHSEWSDWKSDPSFDVVRFREDVKTRLASKPRKPAASPDAAPARPKVSLKNVIAAARTDPGAAQGHRTHPADVKPVEAALKAEGLLPAAYASDGSFGAATVAAYAAWQRHLKFSGADANGIPGETSLKALGAEHGFTVVG